MRRSLRLVVAGALVALAVVQIVMALRGALRQHPPPELFRPDAASVETAGSAPLPVASPRIAMPDPANILRITVEEAGLSPHLMRAASRSRLWLLVKNRTTAGVGVVVSDSSGQEVARLVDLAPDGEESVEVSLQPGVFTLSVPARAMQARLTCE